jgi:HlyD family secretion protein
MEKTMTNEQKDELEIAETLGVQDSYKRTVKVRRWLAVAAGLVSMISLMAWVRSDKTTVTRYETQPVERGSLKVTVTATGNLEPINQVDVGSELSGIIRTIVADYNDAVRKGQVLATLDTDRLDAQVLESTAALRSARAKVEDAEATLAERQLALERTKELVGQELISRSDLDTAEAAFKRAQAELASAKAQVAQAEASLNARQTDLGKTVVRSPINGVVLDRNVEPGQTVAASLQAPVLFTLAEDLTQMELHVAIDEADIGSVKEGQAATFAVDAYPGRSFPAEITELRYASETVNGVVTYQAVLRVDNSDLALRPGMTATAEIEVQTVDSSLLVPNAALRFEPPAVNEGLSQRSGGILSAILPRRPGGGQKSRPTKNDAGGQKVWMLKDGQPVALSIETGATDGLKTEVIAGDVEPGLELVVDSQAGGRS